MSYKKLNKIFFKNNFIFRKIIREIKKASQTEAYNFPNYQ